MKGIYSYIDKKDNTIVYVGKDSKIDNNQRHKDHFKPSNYDNQPINRALQNNPDRYTYQILVFDVEDEETLNALEIQYIRQLNTYHHDNPRGFNFTLGGDGSTGYKTNKWKKNLSKTQNTSGIMNVFKMKTKKCKQGFTWCYQYCDDGGKQKQISRVNLDDLEKEVKVKGLPWVIIDEIKYEESKKLNYLYTKYKLWDISSVHYLKSDMFNGGREPNPCKCFKYRYNGKDVSIGGFHDFVSVEIINDLVNDAIGEN